MDLSITIAGIKFPNPIMPASGTFGFGDEVSDIIDVSKLGAVVTKGTTLYPKSGNDLPRILEVRAGIINFIGLQNPGAAAVIEKKIPIARSFGIPVIANISGGSVDEYAAMAKMFNEVVGVSALEVNISCPNVKSGGVAFGQDPDLASEVVSAVRAATLLPLIVKLTPNVTNLTPIATALVKAGANAFSLVNTFKARARIRGGPHKGQWIEGGLSGPCIMPQALRLVSDLYKAKLGLPIIGMGGISCLDDVLDFIESGADAVQIGTANFADWATMPRIIDELAAFLQSQGFVAFEEWKKKIRA